MRQFSVALFLGLSLTASALLARKEVEISDKQAEADEAEAAVRDVDVKEEEADQAEPESFAEVQDEESGQEATVLDEMVGQESSDEVQNEPKKTEVESLLEVEEEGATQLEDTQSMQAQKEYLVGGLPVNVHLNTRSKCAEDQDYPHVILSLQLTKETRPAMLKHAKALAEDCSIHEVHLWNFAEDDQGRLKHSSAAFKDQSANLPDLWKLFPNPEGRMARVAWSEFYAKYNVKDADNTVLVKANDDIVFMDSDQFREAVIYRWQHPNWLMVIPNIVNDDITKLSQKRQGCLADKMHGLKLMNKEKGSAGLTNLLIHEAYLKDASCFAWKTEENGGCEEVKVADDSSGSAAMYMVAWPKVSELHMLISQQHGDEKQALIQTAQYTGKRSCTFTAFAPVRVSDNIDVADDTNNALAQLYESVSESNQIGDRTASVGKRILKAAQTLKKKVNVAQTVMTEGTCPRVSPQLDMKNFNAFASKQPRQQQPTPAQVRLMQTWGDFKSYLPASCLAKCEDTVAAPTYAPLMWSDKYKFVWVQPPRALGANVAKLMKEFEELEIRTGTVDDETYFKDYKVVSAVRNPMKLFLARYDGMLQSIGASSAADHKTAVGTVLSDLMRQIWPGCESAVDGSKDLELAANELAPVFLQMGGRPVDFIIHAETPEEDLRLFFKELGIGNDVARPRLVKKAEVALKQKHEAVQQTISNDKEILQAFCTVYAVDYLAMGYETEFEHLCGSTKPAQTTVRTAQLKEVLEPKAAEEPRVLIQIEQSSCNIAADALLLELPFVDSAETCKAHCEAEERCFGFEHVQSRAVCLLSKSHPDMTSAKDSTCGAVCQDSDNQLAAHLQGQGSETEPRCSEVQHFCDSRTVARFCPVTCRSCEGNFARLAPGLTSYAGSFQQDEDMSKPSIGTRKTKSFAETNTLEEVVREMQEEAAEENLLEEDTEATEEKEEKEAIAAPKKFEFSKTLTVQVHPNPRVECLPSKKSYKPYVLLAVWKSADPANLRTTLAEKYAKKLADQCSIHELHIFSAQDEVDQMEQIKSFYSTYQTKFPKSVVLKADDNVVYMDVEAFDKAVAYAAHHPEYSIMLPNMVNSKAGAFHQKQQGCLPAEAHGMELMTQHSDMKSLIMHEQFLKNPSCFAWRAPQGCIARPTKDTTELGTFIVRLADLKAKNPLDTEKACLFPQFNAVNLALDTSVKSAAEEDLLRIYEALLGKINAGESVHSAARNLAVNLNFENVVNPASIGGAGVCHKAAPQLDLSTCRAFGARSKQVLFDLKQWAHVEDYIPAKCLTNCKDEETALKGEVLYSDKYKFIWLSPPKAMGSSLENLLKQWDELEVMTASDSMESNLKHLRDYTVISSTREPLALLQARLGNATSDKQQVGDKLSNLLQQIWPGCSTTDSNTMDIAPVFLQFGGRKVDFLVREEFIEEDLEALWTKLDVDRSVRWPKLVRKSDKAEVSLLAKTLDDHVDIRKAFCAAYSVDYMCFGYESKFKEICGSIDPRKIKIEV